MTARWSVLAALLALGVVLGTCSWSFVSDHDDDDNDRKVQRIRRNR